MEPRDEAVASSDHDLRTWTRPIARLRRWLEHPHLSLRLALLAMALTLPSLWIGFSLDDHLQRVLVSRPQPFHWLAASPTDLFTFFDGDPGRTHALMDSGFAPWWTLPELRTTFWRPLASVTHWLDYRFWPDHPFWMHAENLVWFGLLVAAVSRLYTRLAGVGWMAGLAAMLYAIDDAHGFPVGWLANRNALMATLFGVLAIDAYDRWRRDGWRPGAFVTPAWLLLGLLSAEAAVAAAAYLFAYAVCLDRGRWLERAMRLLPSALVGMGWWWVHQRLGYGAYGSGLYLDPGRDTARYALAALTRIPVLLLGMFGLPPSDLFSYMKPLAAHAVLALAVLNLAVLLVMFIPLIRREGLARFWALGLGLSLLPVAATFPMDRLLFFAGLGAMGLLAQWLTAVADGAAWLPGSRTWHRAASVMATVWVAVHLVVAPILLPLRAISPLALERPMQRFAESLPHDPAVTTERVVIVNGPDGFLDGYLPMINALRGLPAPARLWTLTIGHQPITLTRLDARTLEVRPAGGFLADPLSQLVRDVRIPMAKGQRVALTGLTVEVTELTPAPDPRPAAATFRFEVPLEDPTLRWLRREGMGFVPFTPPPIGQTVTVPGELMNPFAS